MYLFTISLLIGVTTKCPTDSFQAVEALFAREQYEEAIKGYESLIKFEDTAAEALYRMGECYYNLHRYEDAITVFRHIMESYKDTYLCPEAIYSTGMCWLVLGDVAMAKKYLIDEIDRFPGYTEDKRVLCGKGICLYAEGKYKDALIFLDRLQTKEGLYYRARCYARLGDPLKAIDIYKDLIAKYAGTKLAEYSAYSMGDALFENKDYPGALEKYTDFLAKYPWTELKDYARYKLGCCHLNKEEYEKSIQYFIYTVKAKDPWLSAHSWYQLGVARMKLKRIDEGVGCYSKVKTDYPDMRVAALAHIGHGQSYIIRGDTVGAQMSFKQVVSVYPTGNFAGLGDHLAGTAFYIQGRYVEAIEHYQKVIKLYPASEALLPSYTMQIFCYLQLGRFEEGASIGTSLYKLITGFDPQEPWIGRAKLYLGEAYYYLDRYPKAIDFYDECIKDFLIPEVKAPAWVGRGWCLLEQGKTKDAHDLLKDAYERWNLTDTNLAISSMYGWAISSFNGQDFEDAYTVFLSGIGELYPECAVAGNSYYHGGKAIAALGKYGSSIEYWQKVLDQYPTCLRAPDAAFDLGRIYFLAGKYDEAIGCYETILEDYTKHPLAKDAQFQLAATYYQLREYENAIREFQKFKDLYPEDSLAPQAKQQIATCLYVWGQEEPDMLKELVEKYPEVDLAAEAQWQIAAAAYNVAVESEAPEDYENAIKEFQRVIVNFPESDKGVDAQYYIIMTYGSIKNYEKRIEECRRFLQYFPKHEKVPDVYFQMGATFFNMGRYVDAIEPFQTILDKYKDYKNYNKAGFWLGNAYRNLGEKEKAERLLKQFKEETIEGEQK
ncbi:MAG: tetratricopeptide repeat protein [Candidatus Stahlbacteria bacterium]|nr:tetratricopeptide repeat protein [Candidatus Stahlbacteria bacterium]